MKTQNSRKGLPFLIMGLFLVLVTMSGCNNVPSCVAGAAIVEAGNSFSASEFLLEDGHSVKFSNDFETAYAVDGRARINHVGDYKVGLVVDGYSCSVSLEVKDTKAPTAKAKTVLIYPGQGVTADKCVTDVVDATDVTYTFKATPVTGSEGIASGIVVITDEGGNSTEVPVAINVLSTDEVMLPEYTIEAGQGIPDISDILALGKTGKYVTDVASINTDLVGSYTVTVECDGKEYDTTLNVVDTVAPSATVTTQVAYKGGSFPSASSFVSDIVDAGPVTVTFGSDTPETVSDPVSVKIVLTDQGGNETVYDSSITVEIDEVYPVISEAPDTIEIDVGDNIAWRALVTATDDNGYVDLKLDTSNADLTVPGTYTVTIIASDKANNQTKKDVKLVVHDNSVTQEMMNSVCDEILDKIVNGGMTNQEKVYAVYNYLRNNITYNNNYNAADDIRREAYLGLTTRRKGDCFTFAAAGYELLNRLGFETMIVYRSPEGIKKAKSTHKWVLVNIGTKNNPAWYHFDATPQLAAYRKQTYLMTTAQATAYTNYRADASGMQCYFTFDPSLYPEVSTVELYDIEIDAKYFE